VYGNSDFYVMDADGQNPRNVTNHPANDRSPTWSSDGQKIAYHSDWEGNRDICVTDADGQNQRNLTNHPAEEYSPAWSPDGQKIAFHSDRDGNFEIYVMDADGQNQRNLTNHPARDLRADWFDPTAAPTSVFPASKLIGTWGWLKRTNR